MLTCRRCAEPLQYVHGHGTCLNPACPLKGVNQAECCQAEQAENLQKPVSAPQEATGGGCGDGMGEDAWETYRCPVCASPMGEHGRDRMRGTDQVRYLCPAGEAG